MLTDTSSPHDVEYLVGNSRAVDPDPSICQESTTQQATVCRTHDANQRDPEAATPRSERSCIACTSYKNHSRNKCTSCRTIDPCFPPSRYRNGQRHKRLHVDLHLIQPRTGPSQDLCKPSLEYAPFRCCSHTPSSLAEGWYAGRKRLGWWRSCRLAESVMAQEGAACGPRC